MVSESVCLSANVVSLKDGNDACIFYVKNFEQFNNSLAEL